MQRHVGRMLPISVVSLHTVVGAVRVVRSVCMVLVCVVLFQLQSGAFPFSQTIVILQTVGLKGVNGAL